MTDEDRVVQHLHCPVCGKAIPPDEELCSDVCENKMKVFTKKKKTYNYIIIAMMLIVMAMWMLTMGAPGG